MEFCPFFVSKKTSEETIEELGIDAAVEELRVMCLDGDVFLDLCNLYPQTSETLKIQGLKKRRLFMECLKL